MKRFYSLVAAISCFSGTVLADPIPLFQNYGVITNAIQIDALAFDNRGIFDINSELPYDMQNVINFTNSNTMISAGGFRFDTIVPETKKNPAFRYPANNFVNSGTITSGGFFGSFFFGGVGGLVPNGLAGISQSSYVLVNATNIDGSNGTFEVGSPGLLRLTGKNTDLNRAALIAGDPFSGTSGGFGGYVGSNGTNFYLLPNDITEIYGGAGVQTNHLDTTFVFTPPDAVRSPSHRVFYPGGGTNGTFVSLPFDFLAQFDGVANVSTAGGDKLVQAVFVNTNFTDTNISAKVTFVTPAPVFNPNVEDIDAPAVVVQFISTSYDPITGGTASNIVSFIDTSAMQTNLVMYTNFTARTHVKPSSYEVTTADLGDVGVEGNTPYVPELLYDPAIHASNTVVGFYGGYGVEVGAAYSPTVDQQVNPTNRSPRIEVKSDNLDLTLTRMRSEGPILLETKHLISDEGADISAGLLQADLGSTNGFLRIEKLFPTNFQRLSGEIYGYSFIWNNVEIDPDTGDTNNVKFHVLIVDQAFTANIQPAIDQVILHSTNLLLENDLKVDRVFKLESENLTVNSVIQFNNQNIVSTNLVGLKNLVVDTNGILTGANNLKIGFDTAGLDSIINRGQINAVATLFKSGTFVNSGTIGNATNLLTTDGSIVIQARSVTLAGGTLSAGQLVEISAGDLMATNSTIVAGGLDTVSNQMYGRLVLNITNLITDFGEGAGNVWEVSDGFELRRKPFSGDLLGTEIRTIASGARLITHRWAGQDAGGGPDGFVNNATLGHLILDIRSARSKLRFTGTGTQNALYVKTLDFELAPDIDIDTDLNDLLQIDSNLKIYFINSNAGDKLATAFPDRVIQVPSFEPDTAAVAPLTVWVNGFGIVTPNLNGKLLKVGDTYKVKAKPGKGQVFTGWSGAVESDSPAIAFTMQPDQVLVANMAPNPFDNSANPVEGVYNGLFADAAGVQQESSGFFNLKLSKKGSFTGKIISGKSHPFRGAFDPATGQAQVIVRRAQQSSLTLDLQLDLSNRTDQIIGTVSGDNWTADLTADRARATGFVPGKYTLVIPGGLSPAPNGDSFGTVDVNARGDLRFKGTLADGTRVNQKVNLSKDGRWPLYSPLYHGAGSIFGWIIFTNSGNSSLQGEVNWIKAPGAGRNFQSGFTNASSVIGSTYSAALPALSIDNPVVILSGGGLSTSVTNSVVIDGRSISGVTDNSLRLNIGPATGLLKGTAGHPDTGKPVSIKGVVLQQQNTARGFFLDAGQSGAFTLEN